MDVTIKNFSECLPQIEKAIDAADFISIDGEFTGLRNGVEATAYDTPAEYYKKLREGSLNFLLIQVGICAFKYDSSKKKYVYKAFNFYVFPRQLNKMNNDVNFLCQASSISFLCGTGFDFNKLFNEGIPYLTIAEEEALQNDLRNKYDNLTDSESYTKVPVPDELTSVVEDICKKIEGFLAPENEEKELYIDKCNGFIRKLVFQTAYERFSTKKFSLTSKWIDNNVFLIAQKGKSKAECDKENFEKDKRELKEAIGFSKIIKYISDKKKLIVGHNMLLDICHIINRFCWPLPENYREFKEMVHQLFPSIVDTKYMCNAYPFKSLIPSSVMDHMCKQLREPPFRFPETEAESAEFGYAEDENKAHEAGFDAYSTGLAFIALTSYLDKKPKTTSEKLDVELLKPYLNRLFLMRIMDYSFINLKGEEPVPKRDHIFYITFPKEWKTSDIVQLFNPYGNIHVSYCNQTTAWITLLEPEKTQSVISDLIEPNLRSAIAVRKPYSVVTWRTFENDKRADHAHGGGSSKTYSLPPKASALPIDMSSRTLTAIDLADKKVTKKRGTNMVDDDEALCTKRSKPFVSDSEVSPSASHKSSKKQTKQMKQRSSTLVTPELILNHLSNDGTELQKTFEEPSWE